MELVINDRIRNRVLKFFEKFTIDMKYDSIASTFSFDFLFDPDNQDHKDMACIGHFHICSLKHNDETVLTGYVLSQGFNDMPETELATLGGYSLPGVIEDCQIYPEVSGAALRDIDLKSTEESPVLDGGYPLQSDGLSLKQIAEKYLSPFRIKMVIDPSVAGLMDQTYDETTAKETQTLKAYLTELASQRNIVITHDQLGRLVFTKPSASKKPVTHFAKGETKWTSMSLSFNGKDMHSHIRTFQQQDEDEQIGSIESEVLNPYVPFVFRPRAVVQNSGDANDTENSAKNVLASELKNIRLNIGIHRWDIENKIIRPGEIISVTNPKVYLYKKSNWFVESVHLEGDADSMTARLECVLPEVYTGEVPEYLFKGINLH